MQASHGYIEKDFPRIEGMVVYHFACLIKLFFYHLHVNAINFAMLVT